MKIKDPSTGNLVKTYGVRKGVHCTAEFLIYNTYAKMFHWVNADLFEAVGDEALCTAFVVRGDNGAEPMQVFGAVDFEDAHPYRAYLLTYNAQLKKWELYESYEAQVLNKEEDW